MKNLIIIVLIFTVNSLFSQDTLVAFKKRVLETTEVDIIGSLYTQSGKNAAVTGGVGNESLQDAAGTIKISIPLNADDVLHVEGTASAYSSASSSNLDPFDGKGKDDDRKNYNPINPTGSPWVESSGASAMDTWNNGLVSFSHTTDNRNFTWDANINFATEYDYTSFGFGGGISQWFNQKNTSFSLNGTVFIDKWDPESPIELVRYYKAGNSSTTGFFQNIDILDENGNVSVNAWKPIKNSLLTTESRNSYTVSLGFSQIVSKNAQFSLNVDIINQNGWLANPMQRVYFKDIGNYYVGNKDNIKNYTNSNNADVFQLADDIERLPSTRTKIPIGLRFNYYINERFVAKTFLRYYIDNWGLQSQTIQFDLPIKIKDKITLYPTYRFYSQTKADYYAGYEEHLSTQEFYTSDNDLSTYNASQFGLGIKYRDIFADIRIWKIGLKSATLRYSYYQRNNGFTANILSMSLGFLVEKIDVKRLFDKNN